MGSLKQLKPQFPDPHQTLKLSHIMVIDMDMAIHITDITGEERSDPLKPDLKPRATQSHIMVIEATTEDTEDTTEAGGDERDGLLTPSLKQLKPQFPDPHQTLKLSHIMVMDMDM